MRGVEIDLACGQRVGQRGPIGVGERAHVGGHQGPGGRRGPDQAAAEPRALLVGPVDEAHADGQRAAATLQLSHDLEGGEQAEDAVQPAAVGDGVDVRADDQEPVGFAVDAAHRLPAASVWGSRPISSSLARSHRRAPSHAGVQASRSAPGEPPAALLGELVEVGDDRRRIQPQRGH